MKYKLKAPGQAALTRALAREGVVIDEVQISQMMHLVGSALSPLVQMIGNAPPDTHADLPLALYAVMQTMIETWRRSAEVTGSNPETLDAIRRAAREVALYHTGAN